MLLRDFGIALGRRLGHRLSAWVGRPMFWIVCVAVLFTTPMLLNMTVKLPDKLPVLGKVGDFTTTDEQGRPFGSAELKGRAWAANFIFTRCPTVCPKMTDGMARLQHRARNLGTSFHLVSFSVDPEYDTPDRLNTYARAHRASPRAWSFLTGPDSELARVRDVALDGMNRVGQGRHSPTGEPGQNALPFLSRFHGTHAMLVDGRMQIRGYYDVSDDAGVARLIKDVGLLVNRGD